MDIDLQSLCRLCAKQFDHSIDVLLKSESQSENQSLFSNLIQEFFSVIIQSHDGLPSRICLPCKERLESWERIREEVAQAQEFLTQCMLQQTGIHQVVEEVDEAQALAAAVGTTLVDRDIEWEVEAVESVIRSDLEQEQLKQARALEQNNVVEEPDGPPMGDTPWTITPEQEEQIKKMEMEDKLNRSWKDEVEFKCHICLKQFARKENLKQHLVIHSGERSFQCDKCPQNFSRSSDLKVHYRIHTAEKPLQCHYCSQLFRESSNFRKHLRTHSGDRPFKCDICNKHFAQSPHLKRHMRIHSGEKPYSCEICSKQFSQSSTLRTHERTHSGVKPHACKICPKSFRHASTLKSHARTHTGEKAFYCDKCPKSFYWRTSFDCHILTHTSDK